MKLSQLLEKFLVNSYAVNSRRHTNDIKYVFTKFISFVGNKEMSDVSPQDIEEFKLDLCTRIGNAKKKPQVKLSPYRVNNCLMHVRAVFTFALRNGWLIKNPAANWTRLRVPKKLPNVYDPVLMRNIIKAAGARRKDFDKIIEIYLFSGLRLHEGISLRASDVDLVKKTLTVRAENSKTRCERQIPLNSRSGELLHYMIESCGRPVSLKDSTIEHLFADVRRRTSFHGTFHDLRKTFNSWLKSYAHLDAVYCERLLGHADHSGVNADRYTGTLEGITEAALEKLVRVLYPDTKLNSDGPEITKDALVLN